MRLILDTCTFIWVASAEHRLSQVARDLITDPDNEVLVSAATAWEIGSSTHLGVCPCP